MVLDKARNTHFCGLFAQLRAPFCATVAENEKVPAKQAGTSNSGGDERMSLASTTDFVVNVLVTALSKLASTTSAQISR